MAGSIPAGSTMKDTMDIVWWSWLGLFLAWATYLIFWLRNEQKQKMLIGEIISLAQPSEKLHILGPSKYMLLQDENGEYWILPGPFTDADSYRAHPGFNLRGTIRWTWLTKADAEGVCREARKLISTRPWEPRQ